MSIYVKRGSGLLEPFTVPELTMDQSISRGWEVNGLLMEPKREEEFLQTYPMPSWALYHAWTSAVRPATGPFIRGLPAL